MLDFKEMTKKDVPMLREYYAPCDYKLCEYAAGTKLMWAAYLNPSYAIAAGCLVVMNMIEGKAAFDYPIPGPEGDEDAALTAIEDYCLETGTPLVVSVVPEQKAIRLLQRYPYGCVRSIRTWKDYLYKPEDLQNFAGRRYSGQRNHIRKFYTACPNAAFRPLTAEDEPLLEQFWQDYGEEFSKGDDPKAVSELQSARELFAMLDQPWFLCGGMLDGEKLLAVALAEKCGETLIVHIEKALYSYAGVYPAMVQAFAKHFGGDAQWINREDDAADKGLRTSKLQYGPDHLATKYYFAPQNELLCHVKEIPTLTTQRLTLSALTEEDREAYNALVLDQERNRWWGYDDVAGLGGPVEPDSFLNVAKQDFCNCTAVNFAIRLDGKFIGEAVLYRFNYRGDAELGCRIAPEYSGHGYGTEAFAAVAEWGLYKVHLNRVVAKCFRENLASKKMLSACMRPNGEDETFFYFAKLV